MLNISDRKWKEFNIASIFDKIEAGKISNASAFEKTNFGGIEYVAATNRNNGCLYFLKDKDDLRKKIQKGNCIGFIKDGNGSAGYAIYKSEDFVSTVNVIYGYAKWLNRYTGLFFVTAQDMIAEKYSHGYKRNKKHINADKVVLPITFDGQPDYAFMEEFIKEREAVKRKQYLDYCQEQLKIFGGYSLIPLADKHWKSFFIGEIFDYFVPGKSKGLNHLTEDVVSGKSYIGATNRNNGVLSFVQEDKKLIQKGNAIGFIKNGNGSAGYAIYKYESFISTSDVIFAYANWLNKYIGLFIITCSDMSQEKYSHGYKWTKERLLKSGIMLPVNEYGIPDYEYMEKYSKNLLCEKIQRYIKYIENK